MAHLTHTFAARDEVAWRALRVALPYVTWQATFWERAHRVRWSSGGGPWSWGQVFDASIGVGPDGSSVLTVTGTSQARVSLRDRGERSEVFNTLVAAMTDGLARSAPADDDEPMEDRVRYWNGYEWTVEPPPGPGSPP